MSNSINEYMETDLGNVSPNPRGYYNSTSEYEYLDLIEFEGGSYICVIELGSTVKGIAPTPGTSTTVWQCIAIPGDLTPEYQRIYEDVINKHQEVQNNTVHVNEVKSYLDTLKQNIENEVADANTSADNAKTSELKAKTSEELAKNAQTLAENSNKETNKTISDFNDNLQNVIDESVNTINQSKEIAITTINEQKERSVLEVQTETSQYIADEKNIAMQEIHDAIDDFNSTTDAKRTDIIASGDEKINTMNEILKDVTDIQNKVQTTETSTKEYASNAQKSAENAEFSKLSAKAIEDSVIEKGNSIESIHNQILLDKNAVSADKVAVSEMKTSVANISQEIIDKKTEAITAIEEYGAVQVSATQPTSEHVDLWIDDTSEEEYSLPEIKDNEINETDTWSSQKIDNEIGELKGDLDKITTTGISEYIDKEVTWIEGAGITKDGTAFAFDGTKWCSFAISKGDIIKITGGYSNYRIMWYSVIYDNGTSVYEPVDQTTSGKYRDDEIAEITAKYDGVVYVSASTNIYHPCTIQYAKKNVEVDISKHPLSPVMKTQVDNIVFNWFLEPLRGKKISCIGDSIMRGAGNYNVGFMEIIGSKADATIVNHAIAGATLASGTSASSYICEQIDEVDSDSDYIIIEGGFNDLMQNVPLGTLSVGYRDADFDTSTFYGALESTLKKALLKRVGAKVGFVIPHRINNSYRITSREDGLNFNDFRDAIIKTCVKYSIPVCDLYAESNFITDNTSYFGVNTETETNPYFMYTSNGSIADGVHPTQDGYELFYVPKVEKWLALM